MISKEDWEKSLKAWENVKKQANIDNEQADLFIVAVKKKLEEFPNAPSPSN